ncbi:MAG: site-2 protease family protein [Oscillospiraceae bacterium]
MALTALAGPVSNVLLAYIAVVILNFLFFWLDNFGGGWLLMGLMQFFIYVEIISAGLAVFNVFPIPPLDGSKVLFALFPTGRMTSSCATNDTAWDF